MAAIGYKFTIYVSSDKNIHKGIRILKDQTFKDLHHVIMKAFRLVMLKGASFYVADKKWKKGQRIALHKPADDPDALTMDQTQLGEFVENKNQKFIYECKTENSWTFHIELLDTQDIDIDDEGRFPKWEDTSGIPLPEKKKFPVKSTPIEEEDDDDEFEAEDETFSKGFDELKSDDDDDDGEEDDELKSQTRIKRQDDDEDDF